MYVNMMSQNEMKVERKEEVKGGRLLGLFTRIVDFAIRLGIVKQELVDWISMLSVFISFKTHPLPMPGIKFGCFMFSKSFMHMCIFW